MFRKWMKDIKDKTANMTRRDKVAYVLTYYWYHLLIIAVIIVLIFLFGHHYMFGNKKPQFFCAMVNQEISNTAADKIAKGFAKEENLKEELTVIDPNYIFSYGDVVVSGANESSYDKFFLQWRMKELDAVVMPESFYLFCREMGGEFREIQIENYKDFEPYFDEEKCTAVVLGYDSLTEKLQGKTDEKLLLAFPNTGTHKETAEAFLDYLSKVKQGKAGGIAYEEIINR